MPKIAIGLAHYRMIAISLVAAWAETLVVGYFGFEQTYTDWRKASLVALLILPFILVALRGPEESTTMRTIPGWWFFVAIAILLTIWPAGYTGDVSPLGDMLSNFFLVGMTEELVFRGVIQDYLLANWSGKWLGISKANWATSILFAWMHNFSLSPDHLPWFVYLLPMSLFYGILRDRTGNWLLSGVSHGLIIPALYFWGAVGAITLAA